MEQIWRHEKHKGETNPPQDGGTLLSVYGGTTLSYSFGFASLLHETGTQALKREWKAKFVSQCMNNNPTSNSSAKPEQSLQHRQHLEKHASSPKLAWYLSLLSLKIYFSGSWCWCRSPAVSTVADIFMFNIVCVVCFWEHHWNCGYNPVYCLYLRGNSCSKVNPIKVCLCSDAEIWRTWISVHHLEAKMDAVCFFVFFTRAWNPNDD